MGSETVLVDAVGVVALAFPSRFPAGPITDLREAGGTEAVAFLEVLLADEPATPVTALDDLPSLADLTEPRNAHATG